MAGIALGGRLDVLVNNAAILHDTWQRGMDADLDLVHQALETNLLGAWRTTQACLPLLRRSSHGRIVNVSSGSGSLGTMGAGAPAYSVSKAALNALTRILAAELRSDGILVNSVWPGWVATDMGGPGGRPVEQGAANFMWAVLLPDDGPSGGCFRDGRPVDRWEKPLGRSASSRAPFEAGRRSRGRSFGTQVDQLDPVLRGKALRDDRAVTGLRVRPL